MTAASTPGHTTSDSIFAVVVATRTGTRFVSHHRTEAGADAAASKHNATYPKGTRACVTGVRVED